MKLRNCTNACAFILVFSLSGLPAIAGGEIAVHINSVKKLIHRGVEWQQIVDQCSAGLVLEPNNLFLLQQRGIYYRHQGELRKALADLDRVVRLAPRVSAFHYERANVLVELKLNQEALQEYNAAIELTKNEDYYLARAELYLKLGLAKKALDDCNKSIELIKQRNGFRGKDDNVYLCRARAHERLNQYDAAIVDYTNALYTSPAWKTALSAKKLTDENLREITKFNSARGVLERRGKAYEKKGDLVHALQDFDLYTRVRSQNVEGYLNKARVYSKMGNFKQALVECNNMIKLDPGRPAFYYERAKVFEKMGNSKSAKHDIAHAEKLESEFSGTSP